MNLLLELGLWAADSAGVRSSLINSLNYHHVCTNLAIDGIKIYAEAADFKENTVVHLFIYFLLNLILKLRKVYFVLTHCFAYSYWKASSGPSLHCLSRPYLNVETLI